MEKISVILQTAFKYFGGNFCHLITVCIRSRAILWNSCNLHENHHYDQLISDQTDQVSDHLMICITVLIQMSTSDMEISKQLKENSALAPVVLKLHFNKPSFCKNKIHLHRSVAVTTKINMYYRVVLKYIAKIKQ